MHEEKDKYPMVTVRCITYNHAKFIRDALEGFIKQETSFPYEVLIHDDCSTDGTDDIIREYVERYPNLIRPFFETENCYQRGLPFTVDMYAEARGKYIALCEGDDYWINPQKLQLQFNFMENHPDCSMCFSEAAVVTDGQEQVSLFGNVESREYSPKEYFEKWVIATCTTFLRKEVLVSELHRKVIEDNRFVYGDLPLWLTASHFGKVYGCDIPMGCYRRNEGGLTQKKQSYEWGKKLYYYALAMHEIFPETNDWNDSFGAGNAYAHAKKSFSKGHFFDAAKAFFHAKRFDSNFITRWLKKDMLRLLKK